MRKYPIKVPLFIILAIVLLFIAKDIFLAKPKSAIEEGLSKGIGQRVSIESITYLPPNFLILNNTTIQSALSIKRITLRFSLLSLILKRNFAIIYIGVNRPRADYRTLRRFLKENFRKITLFIKGLTKDRPITLAVKQAVFSLIREDNLADFVSFDSVLKIDDKHITSRGRISSDRFEDLTYTFRGIFTKENLIIENLEVSLADFQTKLWGGLKDRTLTLHGLSLLRNLYILDLHCLLDFAFPKIAVKDLRFSVNKMPFQIQADILLSDPALITLSVSTQSMQAIFKNLSFYFTGEEELNLSVEETGFSYMAGSHSSKMSFKDFNVLSDTLDKHLMFVRFHSRAYDGSLSGEGYIDTGRVPPKCVLRLNINDADAHSFESLLNRFSDVHGVLETEIYYRTYPRPNLNGEMIVRDGYLENLDFFVWLADSFNIPALKKVDFESLSIAFLSNELATSLHKISLDSPEVSLNGYFNISDNNFVSGKLSLGLSRAMLEVSKFKPLLRFLEKDATSLDFAFQLSGPLEAMNFKWLESNLKARLQKSIPGFAKDGIEKQVEEAIATISAEETKTKPAPN